MVLQMEPSELYNRSKRNLAVFAGILALFTAGAIEPDSNLEVLGLRIGATSFLLIALFSVNSWLIYQFWFSWRHQAPNVHRQIKYDFIISLTLAVGVLLWAAASSLIALGPPGTLAIVLLTIVSAGAAAASVAVYAVTRLGIQFAEILRLRKATLRDRLLQGTWILMFDPLRQQKKTIEFLGDGSIGVGGNEYEARWELASETLTIWKADATLQNRFRYDGTADRFVSTDDALADAIKRGFKGQYIYRGSA